MFKLQDFIMPQTDICGQKEMFFRTSGDKDISYNYDLQIYNFMKGDVLKGNTYFNGFSAAKWKKYTSVHQVFVLLDIKGRFEVSLIKTFLSDSKVVENLVKQFNIALEKKEVFSFSYDFSLDQFDGIYYVQLTALEDGCQFYGGGFYTDQKPEEDVRLGGVICTYKREEFIYSNLNVFKRRFFSREDLPIHNHFDLFVVDNAHTLDEALFNSPHLHLFFNKNAGGAGGFTRGIIEILRSTTPYTHIILMDDDALLNVYSFELTFSFLSFLKKEYTDLYIGGSTLRLDRPNIQLESGAVWNNNLLFNVKGGLNLTSVKDILFNDLGESRSYNAWVFNCIPVSGISLQNLPLPLFVRGDDMEYGMRNSKKIVALNGICAWHAPLHNKYSAFMIYYELRNQLIINALYDDHFSAKSAVKLLRKKLIDELLKYRYENIELVFKAYCDFLAGVPFLLKTDVEALHQEIMKYVPPMLNFDQLSRTSTPFIYDKLKMSMQQKDGKAWKRLIRRLVFNGYLVPRFFYKKSPWDNYGVVELASARPIQFFRKAQILQVDLVAERGCVTHISKIKCLSTLKRFIKLALYIRCGAYARAQESFKTRSKELSKIDFWKKYLELEGDI